MATLWIMVIGINFYCSAFHGLFKQCGTHKVVMGFFNFFGISKLSYVGSLPGNK